jgi:hypothetical protein
MAFTITFPTSGPAPTMDAISSWLVADGEPFEDEGPGTVSLRALPVRLVLRKGALQAWIEVTPDAPLSRVVDLLFSLSMEAGSDVRLVGTGEVTRPQLWVRLADEQDRMRINRALDEAEVHGNHAEVLQRLWAVLTEVGKGRDLRWDPTAGRVVEFVEVGVPGGLPTEEAHWLSEDPHTGDLVARPVEGALHLLLWRWLSEAYPGLDSR